MFIDVKLISLVKCKKLKKNKKWVERFEEINLQAGLYSKNDSSIFKLWGFWRHCNILFDMHLFVKTDYVLFIEFFSYCILNQNIKN